MELTPIEARVLGALMEKEMTTPEYYPLSLNALLAACNQKSSRDPVMTLSEDEARCALRSLEDLELVSVDHGSRVQRYEHRARTVFHLRRDETAVLCLLLLRGPQTASELRSRADRLHAFDDTAAVGTALARLASPAEQRPDAVVQPAARQPGTKEQRFTHTLVDPATLAAPVIAGTSSGHASSLADRVTALEQQVEELRAVLEKLESSLGSAAAP